MVVEGEGHGFVNPENQMAVFEAADRFIAQHLGGRSGQS